MSPGGHLLTTTAACATSAALTGSLPLTAGIALGGFLIDVDHALDYVLVERQRDLRPAAFLRYYMERRPRRAVLLLHSYELFALLTALAWWLEAPLLWGYLLGGFLHLGLDLRFNGEATPRSIGAFYSFAYRLAHRFDTRALLGDAVPSVPRTFWAAFFAEFAGSGRSRPAAAPESPEGPAPARGE
ncbi:MAG: hypothetical protein ACREJV_04105 [Candidatus Rokuibacteriota bacterium]